MFKILKQFFQNIYVAYICRHGKAKGNLACTRFYYGNFSGLTLSNNSGGNYTTSGVSGRITTARQFNAAGTNGECITSATALSGSSGPFIPLMDGDSGVRSIESITMLTPDVGLFALVLVKPLTTTVIREITAPSEKDYLLDNGLIPRIYDDAFLGFLISPSNPGIAGAVITGDLKVIWT